MTDKFDPKTHKFGMAYTDSLGYVVYPQIAHRISKHIPLAVKRKNDEADEPEYAYSDSEAHELTRAPEHDLVPRTDPWNYDMTTAPKDGTIILVYDGMFVYQVDWSPVYEEFCKSYNQHRDTIKPIAWQPLPAAPQQQGDV